MEFLNEDRKYCPECQVGVIRRKGSTYYTWIENELVIVPDFPCWVCDVCGHRDWDQSAVLQLGMLLSPTAGTNTFDWVRPAAPQGGDQEKGRRKPKARRSAI